MNKKIVLTILAVLSFIYPVYCQVSEDQSFEYNDFSGLLQSMVNPYIMPSKGAVEARNLRANDRFATLAKREKMLQFGTLGSFPIKSLFRYYKSDDTKYLIATGSTSIFVDSNDDGTFETLLDQVSTGKRWQFETYKDKLIMVNGTDRPKKYDGKTTTTANTDGARTASILAADLGAPFAELNTGANLDASSWYQYKIAFYDGSTYKWSDARSNPILTGSSVQDISLTDIPLGPAGTTQRVIYRTEGKATRTAVEATTSFYRVATIANNTATTYNDAITDAAILADTAPTWATASAGTEVTPPVFKFIVIHKEHLFGANIQGGRSDIYWSKAGLPDYFDSGTDFDEIRPDDGDQITSLKTLLGLLVVLKTNTVQKYLTDTTDTTLWRATDPFSFVGCPAPYTPQNTPLGIVYLARDGLYLFNGENSQMISDVVTPEIKDISPGNLTETVAVYNNNEYHLSYASSASGSGINDVVMVLDTVRNSYVLDDKNIDSFAVLGSGTDFGTIFGGSSDSDGKISVFSDAPDTLNFRYKSDLEEGTTDTATIFGTEDAPFIDIGWDTTLDTAAYSAVTINTTSTIAGINWAEAIIDRPRKTGYWYSPITQIDADSLIKLYWNEDLGGTGDVTFAIRSGASAAAVASASWSSEFTNPNGSDISALTANTWVQMRATLTTSDITETPLLFQADSFVIRLSYNKQGSTGESSILTQWKSGFNNFGIPFHKKRIKAIEVHYTGTTGTLTVALANSEGDISQSFDINLATLPGDSTTDAYTGNSANRIYTWNPPLNSVTDPSPIGEFWQFTVSENGTEQWKIYRIKILYDTEEYYGP